MDMSDSPPRRLSAEAGETSDYDIKLEFAYTSWGDSCKDPYTLEIFCRRQVGHKGEHAAGFTSDVVLYRWENLNG
jgi:hypothetical protein